MNCIEGNRQIINQISGLLSELDNEIYTRPIEIFKGASVGQHFRHIADFYLCLLKGVKNGVTDYALRERDARIETDSHYALEIFTQISNAIAHISENLSLRVLGDFSGKTYDPRPLLESSAGRELMFAHDHAVHHLAMIKIGIEVAAPHISISDDLGVAPSTMKYRIDTAAVVGQRFESQG